MKITFLCEHENGETITIEKYSPADSDELFDTFERFVHACGMSTLDLHEEELNQVDTDSQKSKAWSWTVEQLKNNHKWDWEKTEIDHLEAPTSVFGSSENCAVCGLKTEIMERERCYDPYCPKNENANKR